MKIRCGYMVSLRNLAYFIGLAIFYHKYVPLVGSFQLVLVPLLLVVACLTWKDLRRGILFFIFVFPLINNIPYFFGIYEPSPMAPTALILFLFFFLGVLLNRDPIKKQDVLGPGLMKPLLVFVLVILVSAAVTFFRYANFFPLHGFAIYEVKTNTFGVSAGGAIMSVFFQSLNYLTGLAFFWILTKYLRSKKSIVEALSVLWLSSIFALGFALFQHFGHGRLGNSPANYLFQLINGTFKDAMSFGAYLAMAAPLFLGVVFASARLWRKIAAAVIVFLSFYLVLFSGSRIGLISLLAASVSFAVWGMIATLGLRKDSSRNLKHKYALAIAFLGLGLVVVGALGFRGPILARIRNLNIVERLGHSREALNWRIQALWGPAIQMMADYPISGIGIGAYIIEVANYRGIYPTSGVVPESAENYFLQIGAELGIVGILVMVWISWALFREIRKGFRVSGRLVGSKNVFLVIGGASGILAFFIDSQMHSFIGSYEIKYMLWFLIALLLCLSRLPEEKRPESMNACLPSGNARAAEGRPGRGRLSTAIVISVLVYGATLLWNSTHSLSLQSRTEKLGLVQEFGLYQQEKTSDGREFRWTREYGAIPIKIDKPLLSVPIHASHPDIDKKPVLVQFYLVEGLFKSQRLLKEITIGDHEWRNVDLSVAGEKGASAILFIKISRTWNPQKATGVPDPRNLGVAVGKVMEKDL